MKKVLVTGHLGYIGAHLVPLLQKNGHHVTGCDIGLFEGCEWELLPRANQELKKDYRALTAKELYGFDCVMHLAAISNDPMGNLNPEITYSNNREGSIDLAVKCKKAGIPRFLFSSSCSIYGQGVNMDLEETDATRPLSPYAVSKIDTETALMKMADETFCPVYLRNATAYGHSPSLRTDLVVNNLLGCAVARGEIHINSDGQSWRPLIHCKDIARAFVAILEAPVGSVHNQIINIGGSKENFKVKNVAGHVQELLPNAKIVYTGKVGEDPRNYRVKFDKLNKLLPEFHLAYTLESGMKELFEKYKEHNFGIEDFEGDQFIRLNILSKRYKLLRNDI